MRKVSSGVLTPRRLIPGVLGIALAATLLALFVRRAGVADLGQALGSLSIAALAPALICELTVQMSRALKWVAILQGVAKVRYRSALSAVVIGAASTHLVPLRLDEVVRAAVLSRKEGLPAATVLGTIAIDRLLDVLFVALLLGLVPFAVELPPWMRTGAGIIWLGFLVAVLTVAVLLRAEQGLRERLSRSNLPGLPRLAAAVESLAVGLRSLPRGRALIGVGLGVTGEWVATIVFYAWMLQVFAMEPRADLSVLMAVGNSVAYAVPNVPGALGMYEAIQTGILEQVGGMAQAPALVLAMCAHAVLMLPVTLAGLLLGLREWKLGGLRAKTETR